MVRRISAWLLDRTAILNPSKSDYQGMGSVNQAGTSRPRQLLLTASNRRCRTYVAAKWWCVCDPVSTAGTQRLGARLPFSRARQIRAVSGTSHS